MPQFSLIWEFPFGLRNQLQCSGTIFSRMEKEMNSQDMQLALFSVEPNGVSELLVFTDFMAIGFDRVLVKARVKNSCLEKR